MSQSPSLNFINKDRVYFIVVSFIIFFQVCNMYLFVTVSILRTQKIGQRYQEELHDSLQATHCPLGEVDM